MGTTLVSTRTSPHSTGETDPLRPGTSLILFDGVCNLCNGWVNFVIDRDPKERFVFAPLQFDAAASYLAADDIDPDSFDSIVLVETDRKFTRSDAILRICSHLSGAWPAMGVFRLIPRPVRDAVYNWIASHRYDWFGKRDTCRVPTPELASRFL